MVTFAELDICEVCGTELIGDEFEVCDPCAEEGY